MSKGKITGIVFGTLGCLFCLDIIFWHICILTIMPTKLASYTFNVDKQVVSTTDAVGKKVEVEKPLLEINVYDNFYEVIINSIWDEKQNSYFSYCFQFVSNSDKLDMNSTRSEILKTTKIGSREEQRKEASWLSFMFTNHYDINNVIYGMPQYKNTSVHTYIGKSNGTEMSWQASDTILEKINASDFFWTIQLTNDNGQKELFGMTPKGTNIDCEKNNDFYVDTITTTGNTSGNGLVHNFNENNRYVACDIYYILDRIFYSLKNLQPGTNETREIVILDWFDYLYYDGKTYQSIFKGDSRYAKVVETAKSSFVSDIKINSGTATNANESLIHWFKGVENFGVTAENTFDYETSFGVLKVSEKDFDVVFKDETYTLTLCDSFFNNHKDDFNKVRLEIVIDAPTWFLENAKVNTDYFICYSLNGTELNIRLENYKIGGAA